MGKSGNDINLYDLAADLVLSPSQQSMTFATSVDDITDNASKNSATLAVGAISATSVPAATGVTTDWYLINAVLTISNQPGYAHNSDNHQGPYLTNIDIVVNPPTNTVGLYQEAPDTYDGSTNYTSEVSGTIGANVGFSGQDPTGGVSGDVGFSKSVSYSLPDLTIKNDSVGGVPQWSMTCRGAGTKGLPGFHKLTDPSFISCNTLEVDLIWVWTNLATEESGTAFDVSFSVTYTYEYRFTHAGSAKSRFATTSPMTWNFSVPFPVAPVQSSQASSAGSLEMSPASR